jgi:hypothetical protein
MAFDSGDEADAKNAGSSELLVKILATASLA